MKLPPTLYIPEQKLEFLSHCERIDLISAEIRAIEVEPETLVYCGVEGRPIVTSGRLLPMDEDAIYGCTYEEFIELSEAIDKFGGSHERTPVQYAMDVKDLPALIGYEEASLIPSKKAAQLWLPKPDRSLAEAAKVLLLFAR